MSDKAGWISSALIDLAEYHNGAAFGPNDWSEDGIQIIRIEQLNNSNAVTDKFNGVVSNNHYIDNSDLVFSWSATLKVLVWNRGPGALNQHLYEVVPKKGMHGRLLLHIIDFNMEKLANQSQGSTMRHVTRKELSRFRVYYPQLECNQQGIAKVLDTIDQHRDTIKRKTEKEKAGLMQDLLTGKVPVKAPSLEPNPS